MIVDRCLEYFGVKAVIKIEEDGLVNMSVSYTRDTHCQGSGPLGLGTKLDKTWIRQNSDKL